MAADGGVSAAAPDAGGGIAQEDDLREISFMDKTWLSYFPLNVHTALDYFALSPFYDRSSNNELVRQQRLDLSVLRGMTGIQFTLVQQGGANQNPYAGQDQAQASMVAAGDTSLFVVQKARRESEKVLVPLQYYYICMGKVYVAPVATDVFSARLAHCMFHVQNAFSNTLRHATLDVDGMYKYRYSTRKAATEPATKEGMPQPTNGGGEEGQPLVNANLASQNIPRKGAATQVKDKMRVGMHPALGVAAARIAKRNNLQRMVIRSGRGNS
ncbi:Mediator of RNA polymerase II transcription subunit 6 [Porphyridium purpureum]|uniref:Mediator of RNA polymerase II transcription subunit 6 n=1 Tax=Porphyridium purpureum TaxID=35688 RepID=A0A5J4Z3C0_PORPP|nr:Mediator of RNA polymerase II transcription subunit 6 [Porphyridium purpureum]|eukprot:POR2518..scf295_1